MSRLRLSNNFTLEEFACPCCNGLPKVTEQFRLFIDMLQNTRDIYGANMRITSGYRCARHNKAVGGVSDSSHLKGIAADVACSSDEARLRLVRSALQAGFERIGVGYTFIHLDIDNDKKKSMWLYSK